MPTKQISLYPSDEMLSAIEAHKADNGYQSVQDTIMHLLCEALAVQGRQVSYTTPKRGGYRRNPKAKWDGPFAACQLNPGDVVRLIDDPETERCVVKGTYRKAWDSETMFELEFDRGRSFGFNLNDPAEWLRLKPTADQK